MPVRYLPLLLAVLLCPAITRAELLVGESFQYDLGDLTGRNSVGPTGSISWNGGWTALNGTTVSSTNLQYVSPDGAIQVGGDSRSVRITNTASTSAVSRRFTQISAADTIYFSFLFRTEPTTDGSDFIHFMLNNDAGANSNNNSAGIGDVDTTNNRFGNRIGNSNGGNTSSITTFDYQANTTYLLVGRVENVNTNTGSDVNEPSQPDRVTLWVNPTTYDENAPGTSLIVQQGDTGGTFTTYEYFTIRTFNLDSGDFYYFDELRIGTTWESVVPEPGSLGLLVTALPLMLRRKRRAVA